jgi:hypothetical protein
MKTITTVMSVTLMIISVQSFAQFNKGRWLADGTVGLSWSRNSSYNPSTDKTTTSTSRGFNLAPKVGYFIADRLVTGLMLDVSKSHVNFESYNPVTALEEGSTSGSTSISVGPFVRYYLPMSIFFQGSATFGRQRYFYENSTSNGETLSGVHRWSISVGYAYFLNDYVAIEPSIGYQNNVTKDKDGGFKITTGSVALRAGLSIYLGERK